MFTQESVSTFNDLLSSVVRTVDNNIKSFGSLKDIKDISIGVIKPLKVFPSLVLYPISETINKYYSSNNYADVSRTIRFEIHVMHSNTKSGYGLSVGLLNNLKSIFYRSNTSNSWKLKNSKNNIIVFNNKIGTINNLEPIKTQNGLEFISSLEITFNCQIRIDTLRISSGEMLLPAYSKEVVKIIEDIFKSYKSSLLSDIKTIKYGKEEGIEIFPAILIKADTANVDSKYVGVDTYVTNVLINCYTMTSKVQNLYQNIELAENIRNIMFANKFLFNRALDYQIGSITFGISDMIDSFLWVSQLAIDITSLDRRAKK